ncbi:unnamed protein product, partial [Meganyctiphanes norvegica]
QERQMHIQHRKKACRKIGGECIRRGRSCPPNLPIETSSGRPFCKKRRRCCYAERIPVTTPQSTTVPSIFKDCYVTSSGTSYWMYKEERWVTWNGAKDKCANKGLILATPPLISGQAIALWWDVLFACGADSNAWLAARGNGTQYVTQPDGTAISNTSPLWAAGQGGTEVSTDDCMWMYGHKSGLTEQPHSPYWSGSCTYRYGFPLCQERIPVITPQSTTVPSIFTDCYVISSGTSYWMYKEDRWVTWNEARLKCIKEGLILATPPLISGQAIALWWDVLFACGADSNAWLAARGDGMQFVTQPDGTAISNTSPLWWAGQPGNEVSTDDCMWMYGHKKGLTEQPHSPYWSGSCTYRYGFPLCQKP